jgi:hypothetical protein
MIATRYDEERLIYGGRRREICVPRTILILSLLVAGCSYNPTQRAINGALIGGGTGLAVGAIAGAGKGALIGGPIGAIGGAAIGAITTPHSSYKISSYGSKP